MSYLLIWIQQTVRYELPWYVSLQSSTMVGWVSKGIGTLMLLEVVKGLHLCYTVIYTVLSGSKAQLNSK